MNAQQETTIAFASRKRRKLLSLALFISFFAGCLGLPQIAPLEAPKPEAGPDHYYFTINGKRVHYVMVGKGPPVLLLHAGGTSWHDWEGIIPVLASNYTVIAPDMPGAGDSEELNGTHNVESYEAFVVSFLSALHLRETRIRLMGMSFGGMTALRFSLDHQDQVDRLVLLEVAQSYTHPERRTALNLLANLAQNDFMRENAKWWVYRLGQTSLFLPFDLDVGPGFLKSSSRATLEILLSWSQMKTPDDEIRRLDIPVLLLAAENDREVYASATQELASLLPNSKIIIVPGFRHYDFGKKNLGAGGVVDQAIVSFLSNTPISTEP